MVRPALDVDLDDFARASGAALADGPLPVKRLGEVLAEVVPRCPGQRAGPPGPRRGTARPAAAAWLLEAVGRCRLPVRRHLARSTRSPCPTRRRSCGATSRRTVRRPRPTSPRGPASPASPPCSRRWTTWSTTLTTAARSWSTCPDATSPTPMCQPPFGCWASTTTCGSPTPAATASPIPAKRKKLDGGQRRSVQHGVRRRLARGSVAGRGRPPGGGRAVPRAAPAERAGLDEELDRGVLRVLRSSAVSRRTDEPQLLSPSAGSARGGRRRRRRLRSRCAGSRSPRRTTWAPASSNAASSSSSRPPSGPTTTTTEPAAPARPGRASPGAVPPRGARRRGRPPRAAPPRRLSRRGRRRSANHARRACLEASRAVVRQRASGLGERARPPTRPPIARQPMARSARHRSRSAPRPPARRGRPSGSPGRLSRTAPAEVCRAPSRPRPRRLALAVATTGPDTDRPSPSVRTTASPTRSRRTATAWCASSPVTSTVEPTAAPSSDGTQWTGRLIAELSQPVEGVAQPAEHALVLLAHLSGGLLLVRGSPRARAAAPPGERRAGWASRRAR